MTDHCEPDLVASVESVYLMLNFSTLALPVMFILTVLHIVRIRNKVVVLTEQRKKMSKAAKQQLAREMGADCRTVTDVLDWMAKIHSNTKPTKVTIVLFPTFLCLHCLFAYFGLEYFVAKNQWLVFNYSVSQ